jgi:hypothetical protein
MTTALPSTVRDGEPPLAFPFRPWVRSTCSNAMFWGMGVILALGAIAWWLRDPSEGFFGKAFTVLLGYTVLFWASLLKIWWTAGKPAIVLDADSLAYQPLQYFAPRRLRFERVIECGPRPGTESYRFVVEDDRGRERELFLNLAVITDKHRLLDTLATRLEAEGLERAGAGWARVSAGSAPG